MMFEELFAEETGLDIREATTVLRNLVQYMDVEEENYG